LIQLLSTRQRHTFNNGVCRFFCAVLLTFISSFTYAHGDLDNQIVALSRQIKLTPDDAKLHLKRAELHRQHENWQEALSDYTRALARDTNISGAYLGRANVRMAMGEPVNALREINQFLEIHPAHIDAHLLLARVHTEMGEHAAAAAEYDWVTNHAERPQPEYFLEHANSLNAAGKPLEAIKSLDAAMARLGPLISLAMPAIELERRSERWDAAIERVDSILANTARKETWYALRAEIQRDAKRHDAALADAKKSEAAIQALPINLRNNKAMRELLARVTQLMNR
jgi:tetratricopeptide (TPR) repeat protein